jgi:hypothetical protein
MMKRRKKELPNGPWIRHGPDTTTNFEIFLWNRAKIEREKERMLRMTKLKKKLKRMRGRRKKMKRKRKRTFGCFAVFLFWRENRGPPSLLVLCRCSRCCWTAVGQKSRIGQNLTNWWWVWLG